MQTQSPYSMDSRPRPAPRPYQTHRSRREKEAAMAEYSSSDGEDNGSHDDPVYDHQRNNGPQHLGKYRLLTRRRDFRNLPICERRHLQFLLCQEQNTLEAWSSGGVIGKSLFPGNFSSSEARNESWLQCLGFPVKSLGVPSESCAGNQTQPACVDRLH